MELLTFTVQQNSGAVPLPPAAFTLSGLDGEEHYELRTGAGVLLILKPRMTAMELIRAADSLHQLSTELHAHLAGVCGACDDCERCPYDEPAPKEIELSDELRAEAGIRENRKLCAEVDKDSGSVIISDAGYDHDLRDVPEYVREMFICAGVSLCDLDQHLRQGDIVYGGK